MPSGNIGYGGGKSTTSDIENVEWNIGTAQLPHVVRYGSGSSQTSQSSGDICRICHCESDLHNPLLTPCYCSGSLKYVHQTCLQQWLTASETNSCELCKFPFIMHTKIKPFNEWESLEMSGVERRRLCCAVLFHCAAAICVIWSLCVLIERAAEEVKRGQIGWPFWTKLVVVTVGLTGGMVFMYIQCRQYLHLCHRWRARNRILLIQNAPEKMHPLSPPSPVLVSRHHLPRSSSGSHPTHGATMHGPGGLGMGCSSGGAGSGAGSSGGCSGSGMSAGPHHHHHHAMATTSGQHGANNRPSHGQIVANIENNPLHYERDWQLDDSSQSSFRPCPLGSGSMTPMPFHDSVHNMYETASTSTTTAASTTDAQGGVPGASSMPPRRSSSNNSTSNGSLNYDPLTQSIAVQRGGQKQQPQQQQQQQTTASEVGQFKGAAPLNSAVFLENSDILNDAQYPKLYHRHSAAFVDAHMPHTTIAVGSAAADHHPSLAYVTSAVPNAADTRRYSDTRLLQQQDPIFNVTSVLGVAIPRAIVSDMDEPNANVTEILFGDAATAPSTAGAYDPLELNIQEMLELDGHRRGGRDAHGRKGRHSLHNVSTTLDGAAAAADAAAAGATAGSLGVMANRMGVFKSLPNLSASSENLLQK